MINTFNLFVVSLYAMDAEEKVESSETAGKDDKELNAESDLEEDLFGDELDEEMKEYLKRVISGGDGDSIEDDLDATLGIYEDHVKQEKYPQSDVTGDLYITVSDPEKHLQTLETFISYKVITNTTRSSFDSSEFVVRRRYQDFLRLSEMLEEEFPTLILPPLPSKFAVKGFMDRFSDDFTETRCHALNQYLQRISSHSLVSFSEHFKTFLTSDNYAPRKQGILSRMSSSFKWNKASNPAYESVAGFVSLFGEKMSVMDRIGERLLLEKQELADEIREFSPALSSWSKLEDDATEEMMVAVCACFESCAEVADKSKQLHKHEFVPPVKEYALYADMVISALKRRQMLEDQFKKCEAELQLKVNEKACLPKADQSYSFGALMGKSPELVQKEKNEKLTEQVEQLSQHKEKLNDDLNKANAAFEADLIRWKKQRTTDMASLLSKIADEQISYHSNTVAAWKNVLSAVDSIEPSNASSESGNTPTST